MPLAGVSLELAARIRACLSLRLRRQQIPHAAAWHRTIGISPTGSGLLCADDGLTEQRAASAYASRCHISLADLVRRRRGELTIDSRPNKGLDPDRLKWVLQGYPHVEDLVNVARYGIRPLWKVGLPPHQRPSQNHKSARHHQTALLKSIRQGQARGTYLVVDISLLQEWKHIQCSPFGAVEKKGVDPMIEVRPIHDLSFPELNSTNKYFDTACLPDIAYTGVVAIARRIENLSTSQPGIVVKILKGDVKTAFRHLMLNAEHVCWMGATFPDQDALVVDLAAPFGWSGSPAFYSAFGRAISWLVSTNSPSTVSESTDTEAFFGYEWVDDHILVEPDRDSRLELAEATLRLSMMAVLGPDSINDSKFSAWSTEQHALGLIWNTVDRTVSMPSEKIQKGLDRVSDLLIAERASKQQLQKLLGSLRHITMCLRAAKPFFQQLQVACNRLRPFQTTRLSTTMLHDLQWFHHILSDGHLEKMPLRFFGDLPVPTINLYMDASNSGLAVLHPARDEFIQLSFDMEELGLIQDAATTGFSINVREHLCMALAAWCWGPQFLKDLNYPHVVCWSDNLSAVAWINRLYSENTFGQEINRALGLVEAVYKFRLSARHLPGTSNRMADAGSRASTSPYSHLWSTLSSSWQQVQVPEHWRELYKTFSENCNPTRWPSRHGNGTSHPGSSGAGGAMTWSTAPGSPTTQELHQDSSFSSPSTATVTAAAPPPTAEIHCRPSSPRSAQWRGIIDWNSASTSASSLTTPWPSRESIASSPPHDPNSQSRCPSFVASTEASFSSRPMTASYGGLLWRGG